MAPRNGASEKLAPGARRSDVPEGEHKESQAQPAPNKAYDERAQTRQQMWQSGAHRQSNGQVHTARDRPFYRRHLIRIAGRYLLREIVVHSPAQTRPRDSQRPQRQHKPHCALPG